MKEQLVKEKNMNSTKSKINNTLKKDNDSEFDEVIDIHTGKVKRMRFTYELRNMKKEK